MVGVQPSPLVGSIRRWHSAGLMARVSALVVVVMVACTSAGTSPVFSGQMPSRSTPAYPGPGTSSAASHPDALLVGVELLPEDPSPGGQLIWVSNAEASPLDLRCWRVRSSTTGQTATIEAQTIVASGDIARLILPRGLLAASDLVQLLAPDKSLIDQTPELVDEAYDDRVWYLTPSDGWRFG